MRVKRFSNSRRSIAHTFLSQRTASFNNTAKISIGIMFILSIALLPKAFTSADPVWKDRYQESWTKPTNDALSTDGTLITDDMAYTYQDATNLNTSSAGIRPETTNTEGILTSNVFDMGDKSFFGEASVDTDGEAGEYTLQIRSIPIKKGTPDTPDIDKAIEWSDACNITAADTNMLIYNSKCVRRPEKYLQYRIKLSSDNTDFTVTKVNFEYNKDTEKPERGLVQLSSKNQGIRNTFPETFTWVNDQMFGWSWYDEPYDGVNNSGIAGLKYCTVNLMDTDLDFFEHCDPGVVELQKNFVGPANGFKAKLDENGKLKFDDNNEPILILDDEGKPIPVLPGTAEYLADVFPVEGKILTTHSDNSAYAGLAKTFQDLLTEDLSPFGLLASAVIAIDNVGNLEAIEQYNGVLTSKYNIMPDGKPTDLKIINTIEGSNKFDLSWKEPDIDSNPYYLVILADLKRSGMTDIEINDYLLENVYPILGLLKSSEEKMSYCYTVNSSPNPTDENYDDKWAESCTKTPRGARIDENGFITLKNATSTPIISKHIKQGKNTLYIASINEPGNILPYIQVPVMETVLDEDGKPLLKRDKDGKLILDGDGDEIEVEVPVYDEDGNQVFFEVNNYASIDFTVGTPSPNAPKNVEAVDISNRITEDWRVVLSWSAPDNNSAIIKRYQIFRSTDKDATENDTWGESVADTTSLNYTDDSPLLNNKDTYYYQIRACDEANNCSEKVDAINIRSGQPGIKLSGRYTEPANLNDGPTANNIGTSKATVSWQTDRESDSKIYLDTKPNVNTDSNNGYSAGSDKQVSSHTIDLTNLQPSTKYYYKATWTDIDNNIGVSPEKYFTTAPAPSFSGVIIDKISVDSASITFTVNNAKSVNVYYGKTEAFGGIKTVNTSSTKSSYQLNLTALDDGSKYYVKLNGFDSDGKEYQGSIHYFNTIPRPRISNLRFQPVKDAASNTTIVSWNTNVPTNSMLSYGVNGGAQKEVIKSKLVTEHEITISELMDDSTYSLVARSSDEIGNLAVSETKTFKTALDTRPPKISKINVETAIRGSGSEAKGQIIISWTTDELATSQIAFGQGAPGSYSNKTVEDSTLSLEHTVVVSDLSTSSIYQVQPLSKDKAGNSGKGTNQSAIVGRGVEDVFTIIFNSLRNIFGIK